MIRSIYKPEDKRYIFFTGDQEDLTTSRDKKRPNLEKYLNKIPQYMFLPSFSGVPKPEVFLHKFINSHNKVIYYCHSGLWKTIADWCKDHNIVFEAPEQDFYRTSFNMSLEEFIEYVNSWGLKYTPYDYQYKAAWLILHYRQSLSQLATRAGKTLIAYIVFRYMLEHGAHNILMIVPSVQLVKQAISDFEDYADYFKSEAVWHKGELCEGSNVTVGTFQSLVLKATKRSKNYDPKFFTKFDVVLVDEAHTLKCDSINTILSQPFMKDTKIQFGFSGSLPDEHTIDSFCCHSLMGPTIQDVRSKELIDKGFLAKPIIHQIRIHHDMDDELKKQYIKCGEYLCSNTIKDEDGKVMSLPKEECLFTMKDQKKLPHILVETRKIYDDDQYIDYLVDLCKAQGSNLLLLEQMLVHRDQKRLDIIEKLLTNVPGNSIVFAHHTEYLRYLKDYFVSKFPNRPIYIIHGSTPIKRREKIIQELEGTTNGILFASYGCVGTGLTFKNMDWCIFAQSFKSQIINKQSIGRLMFKNKDTFPLYDIVDCFPTKRLETQGISKVRLYKNEQIEFHVYDR